MRRKNGLALLCTIILLSCTQAFAWGAKGHQIVAYVGAQLTNAQSAPFWQSNADGLRQLSTVPDRLWKMSSTYKGEAPTHWFQADAYVPVNGDLGSFPKSYSSAVSQYGEATILKNGTSLWRVVQFYDDAVNSFRSGDVKSAIVFAGVMTHYIGDLSQPLHVSENYDGQQSGQKGIHAWFETKNIEDEMAIRAVVTQRAQALLADSNFVNQFTGDLLDIVEKEAMRSLAYRDAILKNDAQYGRNSDQGRQVQLDLAEDRMADGAATLAIVLSKISADAGQVIRATPVPVQDPSWIAPDYSPGALLSTPLYDTASDRDDDCGLE